MKNSSKSVYRIPFGLSLFILSFDIMAFLMSFILYGWTFPQEMIAISGRGDMDVLHYYLFFNLLILLNFINRGHYSNRIPYWQQVRTISKTIGAVVALTLFTDYVFNLSIPPVHMMLNWFLTFNLLILARSVSFRAVKVFKSWELPVTLLGNNQMVIDCFYAFGNDAHTGFRVDTVMLRDKKGTPAYYKDYIPSSHPAIQHVDASGNDFDYILENPNNLYIIDMEGLRGQNRDRLISLLEKNNIEYAIVPPTKRLHLYGMRPLFFFGNDVMILQSRNRAVSPASRFTKRTFDIIASGCALPFLGILTLIVYFMKKSEKSDTPLFYNGKRLGKDGQEFPCWKFCTMRKDADQILDKILAENPEMKEEWEKYQKLKDDPRIDSKISAILRKTSLDELPQLWNVFIGEMSLVGPRPILPQQTKEYGDFLHLYESVRPGITGLWQVSGRNDTTFEQRIYWDGWYIKNRSFWHDIVIILKTVGVMISKRGAS